MYLIITSYMERCRNFVVLEDREVRLKTVLFDRAGVGSTSE